jgi:hypothetical protein
MSEQENKSSLVLNFIFWGIIMSFCIALALAVVIPNLVRPIASGGGLPRPCIINLREINAAAKQFNLLWKII